jgi:hypothetical protein
MDNLIRPSIEERIEREFRSDIDHPPIPLWGMNGIDSFLGLLTYLIYPQHFSPA